MAETFETIINRVRTALLGFSLDQEQYATLSVAMGATDTTLTVDPTSVSNIFRGTMEIDDELVLVQSVDRTTGIVTIQAGLNGRGWQNTVAATHAQTSLITMAPRFPRARMKEAINDTISAMYPNLVVFNSTEITKLAPVYEYPMPANCADVWYVTGQLVGPTKIWQPLPNWRYNPKADTLATTDFPTGKSIQIFDFVTPGQQMKVVYASEPAQLVNDSDPYAATTGFNEKTVDIVTYGALSRLLPVYEAARLQQRQIEATERAALVPAGAAMRTAQYYASLYQSRLDQERSQMMSEIPNFATFQGS
jgi:hypothetical protein